MCSEQHIQIKSYYFKVSLVIMELNKVFKRPNLGTEQFPIQYKNSSIQH